MEERNKKTELLVGLFLLIGLLMLGLLIMQFSTVRELFKHTYDITLNLPDGTGIKQDTPVMLGGRKIGKVAKAPIFNARFDGVIIALDIYDTVKIPADSKFSIGTAGLLGDSFIKVTLSGKDATAFVQPNAEIEGAPPGGLNNMADAAEQITKKVDVALEELRGGIKDLRGGIGDMRISFSNLNSGVLSPDAMNDLKEGFSHFKNLAKRLDEKTLGDETSLNIREAVISFRNVATGLNESVAKLDPIFLKMDSAAGKFDSLMTSADGAVKSIDRSAAKIGQFASDLKNGKGLLSSLMGDTQLKKNFADMIENIKEHGLLFYRDSAGKDERKRQEEAERQRAAQQSRKR